MTLNRLVLKHLGARPLRTALTVGAIAMSVGLVGFLVLLNAGLKKDWSEMQGQRAMVVAKTSFFEKLPMLVKRVEDGEIPEGQRGDHDINESLVDWSEAKARLARNRWWRRLASRW